MGRLVTVYHKPFLLVLPLQKSLKNPPAFQNQAPAVLMRLGTRIPPQKSRDDCPFVSFLKHVRYINTSWAPRWCGSWLSPLAVLSWSPVHHRWVVPILSSMCWWKQWKGRFCKGQTSCALLTGHVAEQALTLSMCLPGGKWPAAVTLQGFLKAPVPVLALRRTVRIQSLLLSVVQISLDEARWQGGRRGLVIWLVLKTFTGPWSTCRNTHFILDNEQMNK